MICIDSPTSTVGYRWSPEIWPPRWRPPLLGRSSSCLPRTPNPNLPASGHPVVTTAPLRLDWRLDLNQGAVPRDSWLHPPSTALSLWTERPGALRCFYAVFKTANWCSFDQTEVHQTECKMPAVDQPRWSEPQRGIPWLPGDLHGIDMRWWLVWTCLDVIFCKSFPLWSGNHSSTVRNEVLNAQPLNPKNWEQPFTSAVLWLHFLLLLLGNGFGPRPKMFIGDLPWEFLGWAFQRFTEQSLGQTESDPLASHLKVPASRQRPFQSSSNCQSSELGVSCPPGWNQTGDTKNSGRKKHVEESLLGKHVGNFSLISQVSGMPMSPKTWRVRLKAAEFGLMHIPHAEKTGVSLQNT